ncbi:dTDP-4-dehydrorhamnose reductase [Mixta tenebrionis]|uniref:dTDP-4-dehydrorhamnose reductase n=1 Tax=Mixta tenebrionis TaxID=2562439 RepID=A0A506VAM5_9GAMM|nr:dTDP-4-dehydrorhamnose reductase [Mixta tenebrionis]TPW42499.1 dTDP-4-dehydrorhamnose reductase [Mixta tenebrionis]
MKILIIGAQGQLGKALYDIFKRKYNVIIKTRQQMDITNDELVSNEIIKIKPDYIFNAAAYTDVEKAETDRDSALNINAIALKHITKASREIGAILFHFSTDYVFDGNKTEAYKETDVAVPINFYGETKLIGEENVRKGMDKYFIIRTSWLFSERGTNFAKKIIKQGMENKSLSIVTDQYSSPTYVLDLASAVERMVQHINNGKKFEYGTYHYGGLPYTNWNGFAKKIIEIAKRENILSEDVKVKEILSSELDSMAKRPSNSRLDCSKIKRIFGIEQKNWNEALDHIIFNLK